MVMRFCQEDRRGADAGQDDLRTADNGTAPGAVRRFLRPDLPGVVAQLLGDENRRLCVSQGLERDAVRKASGDIPAADTLEHRKLHNKTTPETTGERRPPIASETMDLLNIGRP